MSGPQNKSENKQLVYSRRGERRTMSTQEGVEGGCKRYWSMELLLDHTNYFNRLFD